MVVNYSEGSFLNRFRVILYSFILSLLGSLVFLYNLSGYNNFFDNFLGFGFLYRLLIIVIFTIFLSSLAFKGYVAAGVAGICIILTFILAASSGESGLAYVVMLQFEFLIFGLIGCFGLFISKLYIRFINESKKKQALFILTIPFIILAVFVIFATLNCGNGNDMQCLIDQAISSSNPDRCLSSSTPWRCYPIVAKTLNDPTICYRTEVIEYNLGNVGCLESLNISPSYSLCKSIRNSNGRDVCFSNFAHEFNNRSACGEIANNPNMQNYCYRGVWPLSTEVDTLCGEINLLNTRGVSLETKSKCTDAILNYCKQFSNFSDWEVQCISITQRRLAQSRQ
jgi:hypothetical protein